MAGGSCDGSGDVWDYDIFFAISLLNFGFILQSDDEVILWD